MNHNKYGGGIRGILFKKKIHIYNLRLFNDDLITWNACVMYGWCL